jgi:hypothetical protein
MGGWSNMNGFLEKQVKNGLSMKKKKESKERTDRFRFILDHNAVIIQINLKHLIPAVPIRGRFTITLTIDTGRL